MRKNDACKVKKGLPHEPSEAGRVGRGRAAEQTSSGREPAARAAQLVRTTVVGFVNLSEVDAA